MTPWVREQTVEDIMEGLEFPLTTTYRYFSFRGQIFQQKFGTAMGSPVSPMMVANFYMEWLEQEASKAKTSPHIKPRLWKRYVDDVLEIVKKGSAEQLTAHINQIDKTGNIKFTYETESDQQIAFLDTLIVKRQDGSIKCLSQKDAYQPIMHFNSHHPLQHKLSVIRTLMDRKDKVITEEEDNKEVVPKIKEALKACG
ncbi:uncharacterized protein [Amphiura filiformis]|uniref:uncharacterized protein n=1 Tax=Amphiura filiformis TaxID=82378 RepID=UPI003B21EE61